MQSLLKDKNVRSVQLEDVSKAQADGFTLIDCRPAEEFAEYHVASSVNVPLFGPINIDSPAKLMKQLLFSFNGMKGTDERATFCADVAAVAREKVLVLCDSGGTYKAVGLQADGRRSRSLVAVYKLLVAGEVEASSLYHVAGGVRGWGEKGFPLEGTDPSKWRSVAGKMPPPAAGDE